MFQIKTKNLFIDCNNYEPENIFTSENISPEKQKKLKVFEDKEFMKLLGIKVHVEDFYLEGKENLDETDVLKVKFTLTKLRNVSLTIIYDTTSEDYELFETSPAHENFQAMKLFLRETKDFQGLLSNFKLMMEEALDSNDIILNDSE